VRQPERAPLSLVLVSQPKSRESAEVVLVEK
jgi:hypothetical protein